MSKLGPLQVGGGRSVLMRYLGISVAIAGLGLACATPQALAPRSDADWQSLYVEERSRNEALLLKLAELEASLEGVRQERSDVEQYLAFLEEDVSRTESERRALEEHNGQLLARQKELSTLHEQLSDLWYSSALSRARRRSAPVLPQERAPHEQEKGSP